MLDQPSPRLRLGKPFPQLNHVCLQRPRTVEVMAGIGFSALGSLSERSLTVRRLLREQDQVGAAPIALTILRDANTGAGQDPHRPGCGGSTPPSRRVCFGLQTLIVKSRLLTGENAVRIRGDPPFWGSEKDEGRGQK